MVYSIKGDDTMLEIWKDVLEFEGIYQVSNLGNVKSLDRVSKVKHKSGTEYNRVFKGTTLIPQPNSKGYLRVCVGGKQNFVHRLVALHFLDNPEKHPIVNHKDGNHLNNRFDNLEWTTNSENISYAYRKGHAISVKGEDHRSSKLKEDDVRWILQNYVKGSKELGRKPLARKFGVSHQTIKNIIDRTKWKHIQL